MIKINITIKDTPVPDNTDRHYGRIEATPENVEPVNKYERMIRDMIMEGIKAVAESMAQMDGITGAFIAEVPIKKKGKHEPEKHNDRRS